VQVVLRYVFNGGFTWALEATTYLFGWMVLIGMSYGVIQVLVGNAHGAQITAQAGGRDAHRRDRERRPRAHPRALANARMPLMLMAMWSLMRELKFAHQRFTRSLRQLSSRPRS